MSARAAARAVDISACTLACVTVGGYVGAHICKPVGLGSGVGAGAGIDTQRRPAASRDRTTRRLGAVESLPEMPLRRPERRLGSFWGVSGSLDALEGVSKVLEALGASWRALAMAMRAVRRAT